MAKSLDENHALITVKVWREQMAPDSFRLHLVSADPDIPNNGIHISVRKHTDIFNNLAQMMEELAH